MTVVAAQIVPNSESTEAPLLVVPLVGVTSGKGSLNVYGQNKMRLVNESDSDPLVVRRGMMLAGFGRGKWGMKDDNFNEETMLLYQLSDSYDEVLSNGLDLAPMLDIVLEKQKQCQNVVLRISTSFPKATAPQGPSHWSQQQKSFSSPSRPARRQQVICKHGWLLKSQCQFGTQCITAKLCGQSNGGKMVGPSSTSNCAGDRSDNQTRAFSVAELSSLVVPRAHSALPTDFVGCATMSFGFAVLVLVSRCGQW